MEGGYINRKLIGIGNSFLVQYLSKRLGYFKIVKSETGNRESETNSLFLYLVYNTDVSKVQIGNKEQVPGSFLTIFGFILVCGFVYFYIVNVICLHIMNTVRLMWKEHTFIRD